MELKIHLPEQSFTDRPTKTQLINSLQDIIGYLNTVCGGLLAAGDYSVTGQSLATLLNGTVALQAARDAFAGVSTAGAQQPRPQMVPR